MTSPHADLSSRKRLLTGDTPTGALHLGHWVGSLKNRVLMQADYESYFLIANTHALTTQRQSPQQIKENTLAIALDYLAAGIDPTTSTLFVESDIPAIYELATQLSMLIPYPRLMRNPTIKDEIRDKQLGEQYSMGFLWYPILQVADILAFQADVVPVGEDQLPHLELAKETARRFNQTYCGVDPHLPDEAARSAGGVFPIFESKLSPVSRLVGLGGPGPSGQLLKMSKSLNNAILLSDPPEVIQKKVMGMYTDPNRLRATDPGQVENNPLFLLHEAFNKDEAWLEDAKARYRAGEIGDVACKKKLIEILVDLLSPMQARRAEYAKDLSAVKAILNAGAERANAVAEATLHAVKKALHQLG